jgi:hypothetical protein
MARQRHPVKCLWPVQIDHFPFRDKEISKKFSQNFTTFSLTL